MPTIPPNNNTGLYGIDGSSVAISNDVTVDNLAATGNITAGANIAAGNNVTVGGNLTVSGTIFGNITGNLVVPGANTQVLFNSDGNAGASSDLTFNDNTNVLDVNGNVQANYFIGDGSQLTNLPASSYGNANVVDLLDSFGSNVIVTTGNITGGYFIGNGSQLTGLPASYSNANVVALMAAFGSNVINTTGNITGGYILGNGSQLTGLGATYSNANVTTLLANFGSNTIVTTGNISGGNITTTRITATTGTNVFFDGISVAGSNSVIGANIATQLLQANSINSNTTITAQGSVFSFGNVTGSNIVGNGQFLTNLSGANVTGQVANATFATSAASATTAGTVTANAQPNITSVGNLTSLTVTGDSLLQGNLQVNGNVTYIASNTVTINDKFINVANNAATASAANGGGIGVGPVGAEYATWSFSSANTAWQSNIKIEAPSLTTTGNVTGSYIIGDGSLLTNINAGNIIGSYGNANVANFLGTGFGSNTITTTGNITGGNINGNGSGLSSITGANVTGQVANALVAGTVYTAAQPAITSVGTLTSLAVTGNISGGNVNSTFFGSGAGLSSLTGANVTGTVANATFATTAGTATSATTAGTVTTNAQPNITSVGTLSTLTVSGNIGTGGILTDGYYYANGTPLSFGGTYGNANVAAYLPTYSGNIGFTGAGSNVLYLNGDKVQINTSNANVTTNSISLETATNGKLALIAANTSITVPSGSSSRGNLSINVDVNINSRNLTISSGNISVTSGNITGDNLNTTGQVVATGNITGGNIKTTGTGGSISGADFLYANTVVANSSITTNGRVTAGAVAYANVDGTAGQVLTTYGNGVTYFSSVAGGSYGNANVNTLLASWGSNTLTTTGNITGGNVIATTAVKSGAVTITGTDGTAGQVLTTYGNGVTYFSTVSGGGNGSPGGSNTQIQFNDAGAFGGNAAMTFDKVTGNTTLGNIVLSTNQQMETVSAYSGNSSVRNPGQITVGDGYGGNITNTTYLSASSRGSRLLSYDQYVKADNGQRNAQLGSLSYADLNGSTNYGTANANSRIVGITNEVYVINGNSVQTNPAVVRGLQTFVFAGTSANVGNANVTSATVNYAFAQPQNGSRIGNAWINFADSQNASATLSPIDTYIGYGIRPNHTANTTSGNIFGVYMPGTASTYGAGISNIARAAGSYYFLRCDDDLAQSKLGSLRTFHEYRYDNSSSSGTLTVNKNNGQVQYVTVTEAISTVTFSNFVVSASDGTTTDYQTDTVTLIFQQDSTGRTITLPTPSTTYKYAGGSSLMGTTANAVQMVSVTATYNAGLAGTQYLITVSPEFS
jgi:hypothetical protein